MQSLLHLAGAVALLLWGTYMVKTAMLRTFGTALRTQLTRFLTAKSSLFRGGFQGFRGTPHSNAPNGISFRSLWHSRFYTGYFYAPKKTRNLAKWKAQTCPPADRALTFMSGP